jgi:hypothetical protein
MPRTRIKPWEQLPANYKPSGFGSQPCEDKFLEIFERIYFTVFELKLRGPVITYDLSISIDNLGR